MYYAFCKHHLHKDYDYPDPQRKLCVPSYFNVRNNLWFIEVDGS